MTKQTICLAGWYQPEVGQLECLQAQPGYYSPAAGTADQIACEPGTYQGRTGASNCNNAEVDHYVEATASTSQTPCPEGSSQPLEAQSECIFPPGLSTQTILLVAGSVGVILITGLVLIMRRRN